MLERRVRSLHSPTYSRWIPARILESGYFFFGCSCHLFRSILGVTYQFLPFLCSLIWLALDFMMPWHLLCFPYPVTYNLHHSDLCPPFLVHLLSPITLSLCHLCSYNLSSSTLSSLLFVSLSSDSLPLHPVLFLSFQHPFITPSLPVPTSSTLHSIPCDSVSHFLHSPYYPTRHTTLSLVVYKSFRLVVYSLACNCCPLLPTQSPLSLPLVFYQSSPLTIQSPCVSPAWLLQN